jgi:phenylalanyl-tRNA synthetase beta chain
MHLSLNLLNDHVDLSGLDNLRIAQQLTMRTALIEGFVDQRGALDGVVVGEVLECGPHPGADRLSVCRVEAGLGGEPARVVCGAPNVSAGQKIIYAPVGTRLPNGLKLKKAKIRGEPSEGMICAEDELGLGPEHDGILVLADDLAPGQPVGDLDGLADVIFEIDNKSVTHRPDLWGHRGFARELAAIFDRELRPLELATQLTPTDAGEVLELEPGSGCPLYAALTLEGAPVRSPDWLRFRLVACGMRPIQLFVDLSNYVMLELGQPTHPFDRDKLADDCIRVRTARASEMLTTLDEVGRTLQPGDVIIADGQQAVAIGGIMGSARAEVDMDSRRVLLESAVFDPELVRRTSSRLGLRTEASARFEKSLDPALAAEAVQRYAALISQLAPDVNLPSTYMLAGDASAPARSISISRGMIRSRLGVELDDGEIGGALQSIGFTVSSGDGDTLDVQVPSWRATKDVTIPEDLVEEVGRIVGYDRVPSSNPRGELMIAARDPILVIEESMRDVLGGRASCTEVFSYSTIRDHTVELLSLPMTEGHPRLVNALQQDAAYLRPSLVPELLTRVEDWLRQGDEVRLFEVGRSYAGHDGPEGLIERRELAILLARRGAEDGRDLVREIRGVAETALAGTGRGAPRIEAREPDQDRPWMHPARSACLLLDEQVVAWFGAAAPATLAQLQLEVEVAVAVFDIEAVVASQPAPLAYLPVSRHPPALIDLAFVVDYATTADQLAAAIRAAGPRTLADVEAFDVYRGKPLEEGQRSIAFHLTFQAKNRTLTDEDVRKARDRIVRGVEQLGARLR